MKSLFNLRKFNYLQTDTIITSNNDNPKAILTRQIENNVVEHLSTLKEQNTIMKHIKQVFIPKLITMYHNICSQMPKNIFIFVRQVLIFSLPNNSNLCRWGKMVSASCILCTSNKQTQLHMLCNCSVSVAEVRYTWRHDSILYTLLQYLCKLKNYGFNIYGDHEGYCKTNERVDSFRADIVLIKDDTIYI